MAEKNVQIVAINCPAGYGDMLIRYIDGEPDAIKCRHFRPDEKVSCKYFASPCSYLSPFKKFKELEEMVGGVTKKD